MAKRSSTENWYPGLRSNWHAFCKDSFMLRFSNLWAATNKNFFNCHCICVEAEISETGVYCDTTVISHGEICKHISQWTFQWVFGHNTIIIRPSSEQFNYLLNSWDGKLVSTPRNAMCKHDITVHNLPPQWWYRTEGGSRKSKLKHRVTCRLLAHPTIYRWSGQASDADYWQTLQFTDVL